MKHIPALRWLLAFLVLSAVTLARGQGPAAPEPAAEPEVQDNDTTPLHVALINYKSGHYEQARTAIDEAEKASPGDFSTELLKARILTEQKEYAAGEKILRALLAANPAPAGVLTAQLALGDLLLREHSFDRAAKYYERALQSKPKDPDILLKLVYAKVGSSDLVTAGNFASQLSPMDPKNPYDDHASYYFAQAALAQATNNTQAADNDIQTARTIYGNTVTNRYFRTYLQVFASGDKNGDITPSPLEKPAPSGAKP